jgi:hypothetical protein
MDLGIVLNGFRSERDALDAAIAASIQEETLRSLGRVRPDAVTPADASYRSICDLTGANEQKIRELRKLRFTSKLPHGRPIPKLPTAPQHREALNESQVIRRAQDDEYEKALAEVQAATTEPPPAEPDQTRETHRARIAERAQALDAEPEKGIALAIRFATGEVVQRKFLPSLTTDDLYCWVAFRCDLPDDGFELRGPNGMLPRTGTLEANKLVHRTLLTLVSNSD